MIDEKKFMEFMTALEENGAEHISFDDLRRFIDEFPKTCWIPCRDRLPEEDKDVLIYTPHDGVDIAYISDENWRYSRGDDFIGTLEKANVLAWQPLPEKYQE